MVILKLYKKRSIYKPRIWFRVNLIKYSRKASLWYEKTKKTEYLFMIIMAVLIGTVSGFTAVLVKSLVEFISELFYSGEGNVLQRFSEASWYWLLIIPVIGGLIVGPVAHFIAPETKGHGVPEVIQAILLRGGIIRPIVALVKSVTSSITIATGGSVGNEGPIVQIGATIGSSIGQFFRVPTRRMKILVGCGAAAGIAAAFNVPVAGALFAIEVILLDYTVASFTPIIISSSIATVISNYFVGNFAEFQVTKFHFTSGYEIINFFVLGAFCGIISFLFIKVLYYLEHFFETKITIPHYLKPAVGGLIIGIIGIFLPNIMGVGNDTINLAINNQLFWYIALILVFLKIISTSITLASGGSGGVLSPSLFIGAMLGAFFGYLVNFISPEQNVNPGIYALFAMGGLIAGTVRAPLTAILLVFELTKETSSIIPLMIVSTISLILSQKLSRESIYTLRLLLNKINLKSSSESSIMKNLLVKDVYSLNFISVPENTQMKEIVKLIFSENVPCLSVHTLSGKFMGLISINTIKDVIFDKDIIHNVVIAGDIAVKDVEKVHIYDTCLDASEKLYNNVFEGLPVMSDNDDDIQIGIIWQKDINDAFYREMEQTDTTTDIANKLFNINKEKDIQFMEGHTMSEMIIPDRFVGRSISGLKLRNTYNVEIISIKTKNDDDNYEQILPTAEYEFKKDDKIIIAGQSEKVNILKSL